MQADRCDLEYVQGDPHQKDFEDLSRTNLILVMKGDVEVEVTPCYMAYGRNVTYISTWIMEHEEVVE